MSVVVFHRFGQTPTRWSLRIVLATVLREMDSPSPRRSAKIFGDPDTSSESPVEPRHLRLDPLSPDGTLDGTRPSQALEPGPGHPQESDHACHGEVGSSPPASARTLAVRIRGFLGEEERTLFFRNARSSFKI